VILTKNTAPLKRFDKVKREWAPALRYRLAGVTNRAWRTTTR